MREEIIKMQRYFARLDETTRQRPDIEEAITTLYKTRAALEKLWKK